MDPEHPGCVGVSLGYRREEEEEEEEGRLATAATGMPNNLHSVDSIHRRAYIDHRSTCHSHDWLRLDCPLSTSRREISDVSSQYRYRYVCFMFQRLQQAGSFTFSTRCCRFHLQCQCSCSRWSRGWSSDTDGTTTLCLGSSPLSHSTRL